MRTHSAISHLVVLPACLALALAPAAALMGCDPNADESGISYTAQSGTSDQDRVSAEASDLMDTLRDPASHDLSMVDLTLTKVNGAWSPDSSSLEELAGKLVEGVKLPVSL